MSSKIVMRDQLFLICQYFQQAASLSLFWLKNRNFWPQHLLTSDPGGLTIKWLVLPKKKGFIVMISKHSYCLLTLHSLDSNFENRLLLSQQPFHHRAKLSWRKKLKHKHSLDASLDLTLKALFSSEDHHNYELLHDNQALNIWVTSVTVEVGHKHCIKLDFVL